MRPVAGILVMFSSVVVFGIGLRFVAAGGAWRGAGLVVIAGAAALFGYGVVLVRR